MHLDYESKSVADLREVGLDNYAKHPTTDLWCMAWAFDDEAVAVWTPNQPFPARVAAHISSGGTCVIQNAAFEISLTKYVGSRYGIPEIKPEQCVCTLAISYSMGLPGALEKAALALGLQAQKDMVGSRLMLQMAQPRAIVNGNPVWWDDSEKLSRLCVYCAQDVETERQLYRRQVNLTEFERRVWVLDQKINARGVMVDRQAARAAIAVSNVVQDQLAKEIREVTSGHVGFPTELSRIKTWLKQRGVNADDGLAKQDVVDLLVRDDLPGDVRRVLEIRQEAAKTSTAKFRPMIEASSADGRLRGMFQYHGAATGRWAARRVQLHNLPARPKLSEIEINEVFDLLHE